ncbi:MAG: DoxX family protein [Cyclobacteriaceae bacterium]
MTNSISENTKWQTGLLVAARILVGWHLLYEGLYKFLSPSWSAAGYLANANGFFDGLANWIASSANVLNTVDFLNIWGLIAIGLGLVLGFLTRPAAVSGAIVLCMYYLFNPPLIETAQTINMEGNYLIVNKTLIEAVVLMIIAAFPSSQAFGLDQLFNKIKP